MSPCSSRLPVWFAQDLGDLVIVQVADLLERQMALADQELVDFLPAHGGAAGGTAGIEVVAAAVVVAVAGGVEAAHAARIFSRQILQPFR